MSAGDLAVQLAGYALVPNPRLVEARWLRRPRSHRRRILKKWSKKPGVIEWRPSRQVFFDEVHRFVIGHPQALNQIKSKLADSALRGLQQPQFELMPERRTLLESVLTRLGIPIPTP